MKLALILSLLCSTATFAESAPEASVAAPPAVVKQVQGDRILRGDAIAGALLAGSVMTMAHPGLSSTLGWIGGAAFLLAPAVGYGSTGHPGKAAASALLRVALVAGTAVAMQWAAGASCSAQANSNNDTGMCNLAAIVPMVVVGGAAVAAPYVLLRF
jgi:hypothetical protein